MPSNSFDGNIPVSVVKQVFVADKLDRQDIARKAIVDKAEPIQDTGFPRRSNSEILFGPFPEHAAVKGVVHDATVSLQAREPGFGWLAEPTEERIVELLEGSIDGTGHASAELKNRISNLESRYGISPDEVLDYEFDDGKTVSDMIQEIAAYRFDNWEDDVSGFNGVKAEESVFGEGMSGRQDLVYWGYDRGADRQVEIKIKGEPREEDKFQASAYWLINDDEKADLMVDYPLIDTRLEFSPYEEDNDFRPEEYKDDITDARDDAFLAINELRDLQSEYFEIYDSREKATREALKELEVV